MDRRKRDWVSVAERLPADDDWPCALATIDRGDFDWVDAWIWGPIPESVTHWMSLAILTAEPEPCEDTLSEWDRGFEASMDTTKPRERHDGINNCLHCGGRAEIVHGMQDGWIACSKCGAAGPRRSSDEDSVAAWNRSYTTQVSDKRLEDLRAQVETLRNALAKIETESNLPECTHLDRYGMGNVAREALAATEPKS